MKDEVALSAMTSHISCALDRALEDIQHEGQPHSVQEEDTATDKDKMLRALRASFGHHNHHLRFATSRADGHSVQLIRSEEER